MERINPYGLKRPNRKRLEFTVNSDENGKLDLVFLSPTLKIGIKANQLIQEKVRFYTVPIIGELPSLPPIEGVPIEYDEELLQAACVMSVLQEEPIYSPEEFLIFFETYDLEMMPVIQTISELFEQFMRVTENPTGADIIPL